MKKKYIHKQNLSHRVYTRPTLAKECSDEDELLGFYVLFFQMIHCLKPQF